MQGFLKQRYHQYIIWMVCAALCGSLLTFLGGAWSTSHSYAEPSDGIVDEMTWSRGAAKAIFSAYGSDIVEKAMKTQSDPSNFTPNEVAAIGMALLHTEEDPRTISLGVEYLSFACDLQQARACRNLAFHIDRKEKRPVEALPIYHKACELGNDLGCLDAFSLPFRLMKKSSLDIELPVHADEALDVFEPLCDEGLKPACYSADDLFAYLGQTEKRIEVLEPMCQEAEPNACWRMADIHERNQNFSLALGVLGPFCEPSRLEACIRAGYFALKISNFKVAEEKLVPACDAGALEACYLYARVLLDDGNSNGMPEAGNELLEQTCHRGHFVACSSYAFNLARGNGVVQNRHLAIEYASAACQRGVPKACQVWALNLTTLYDLSENLDLVADLHAYACKQNLLRSCGWAVEYIEMGANLSDTNETASSLLAYSCANGVIPAHISELKTQVDECSS